MKNIIDQYYPLWFSIASKYSGNYHESEELVEEALAAYLHVYNDNIVNPKAYIARTIYHLYIDKIRRQKQKQAYDKYTSQHSTDHESMHSDLERNAEVRQSLAKMYALLSPMERAVFILKKAFEFDYEKIESLLNISYENCRQLMRRAKDKMLRKTNCRYNESGAVAKFIDAFFKASKYGQFETLFTLLQREANAKPKSAKVVTMLQVPGQLGLRA